MANVADRPARRGARSPVRVRRAVVLGVVRPPRVIQRGVVVALVLPTRAVSRIGASESLLDVSLIRETLDHPRPRVLDGVVAVVPDGDLPGLEGHRSALSAGGGCHAQERYPGN